MTPTYNVTTLGGADAGDGRGSSGTGHGGGSGSDGQAGIDWLLNDLTDRVAEVRSAVMLSNDGLCMGSSVTLNRDESERFAAIASGFHSLAKGAGRHFGAGGVVQTMVELQDGFLFVVAAGEGTCLAVFTDGRADIGLVAYEMTLLVDRVREHIGVATRAGGEAP